MCRVRDADMWENGLGFRIHVQGLVWADLGGDCGYRVQGLGFRVSGFGFGGSGFGFRVSGFGFRV